MKILQSFQAAGFSEDCAHDSSVKWWKEAAEAAKRETLSARRQLELSQDSYKHTTSPVGEMVAEFDAREYFWLCDQYGRDTVLSNDFLLFYQKHRGQQHLAKPSKVLFG